MGDEEVTECYFNWCDVVQTCGRRRRHPRDSVAHWQDMRLRCHGRLGVVKYEPWGNIATTRRGINIIPL